MFTPPHTGMMQSNTSLGKKWTLTTLSFLGLAGFSLLLLADAAHDLRLILAGRLITGESTFVVLPSTICTKKFVHKSLLA